MDNGGHVKVLVIGSGGREHALGWKLAQSPYVSGVAYIEGNAGTLKEEKSLGNFEVLTFDEVYEIIIKHKIDLVIPGSEKLLDQGIVDYLYSHDYTNVFGPTKAAARLESDKFFSFDIMSNLVPQASGVRCYSKKELREIIGHFGANSRLVVLKARGLTGGKGVLVCNSTMQAIESIDEFTTKYGSEVLVSERLYGEEFSVFAVCDGENVTPFPFAIRDYKRLLDNDEGPNTGGMGSHTIMLDRPNVINEVAKDIMTPVIHKMKEMGCEYKGFLYAGMIMSLSGKLSVLEFNCRFGDPECQVAMLALHSDLAKILEDTSIGKTPTIKQRPGEACCVVLTTPKYPDISDSKEKTILIPQSTSRIKIFHAGTSVREDQTVISGGRILNVCGYADCLAIARNYVYAGILEIAMRNPNTFCWRTDIALKKLHRIQLELELDAEVIALLEDLAIEQDVSLDILIETILRDQIFKSSGHFD
jgi:phosphoribosylamine--glycine ligase